ncbi:hypothetical protein RLO149_c001170 [Roseobacter litoralis Och 149]|uniref:Uncharacterized protein n=1 Tax=Roseobacter litoralis (strain ATCC 49566 / DSM 6996 / JCM 21268 / NBRC 15278 / OCh 149) TaxID=391595 RepID=F7ZER8_ROSLO|nr:hypothetical protein RLO149_c001170 [Roseobacter litoralis Och 149]
MARASPDLNSDPTRVIQGLSGAAICGTGAIGIACGLAMPSVGLLNIYDSVALT